MQSAVSKEISSSEQFLFVDSGVSGGVRCLNIGGGSKIYFGRCAGTLPNLPPRPDDTNLPMFGVKHVCSYNTCHVEI